MSARKNLPGGIGAACVIGLRDHRTGLSQRLTRRPSLPLAVPRRPAPRRSQESALAVPSPRI
ncbi:hypothetical protein [Streptomyces sp. NPDC048442]|uniref:hypothetical protein n=1 Tax=Streptomyces sp. NPDC048442 TaxID=3154823 RepID=UPI0034486272